MVQSAAPAAIEYPPLDSGQHVMTPNVLIVGVARSLLSTIVMQR
jgi:hypothetical protein